MSSTEPTTYTRWGITITRQALLVAIFGVLATVGVFVVILLNAGALPFRVQLVFMLLSFVYLAIALYASYVTNCVIVGHCTSLSWLFVFIYLVYAISVPLYFSNMMAFTDAVAQRRVDFVMSRK